MNDLLALDQTMAELVDEEFAKLWPQRGQTRGFPLWEKRLVEKALKELASQGRPSKLVEWIATDGPKDWDGEEELAYLLPKNK